MLFFIPCHALSNVLVTEPPTSLFLLLLPALVDISVFYLLLWLFPFSTYSCGYFRFLPTPVDISVFYLLLWLFLFSTYSCGYFSLLPTPVAISVFYLLKWLFPFSTYSCGYFCFRLLALVSATSPFPDYYYYFYFFYLIFSIKISTVCMAVAEQLSIVDDSDDCRRAFIKGRLGCAHTHDRFGPARLTGS